MCPACISTATVLIASTTSTGGLAAFFLRLFRRKADTAKFRGA